MPPHSPAGHIREIIERSSHIILSTHINPDGDGLGSECALALALYAMNKDVRIVNASQTPDNLRFLHAYHPIEQYEEVQHAELIQRADALILLDANQQTRLASMTPVWTQSPAAKICIDHHPEPERFADALLLDVSSAATGLLVHSLIREELQMPITPAMASALYVAIMTDTGSFRFPKTNAHVHRITAELVQAGADPVSLYESVYEQGNSGRLQLLGKMLAGLTMEHSGRLAWCSIDREMFASTGTSEADTDAFVTYTLQIAGVQMGLLFTELDGLVKVNVRSKGSVPANALAKDFGGNGHLNAAGARVAKAQLQDLRPRVIEQAKKYLQ